MSGSFLSILLILSLPFEGLALYFLIRKIFDVLEYCEDLREAEDAREDCDAAGISGKRTENDSRPFCLRQKGRPFSYVGVYFCVFLHLSSIALGVVVLRS